MNYYVSGFVPYFTLGLVGKRSTVLRSAGIVPHPLVVLVKGIVKDSSEENRLRREREREREKYKRGDSLSCQRFLGWTTILWEE